MKYKVGDKVRVREDLKVGDGFGCTTAVVEMLKYRGKIVTIKEARSSIPEDYTIYEIDDDGEFWAWTDEMLEPAYADGGYVPYHKIPTPSKPVSIEEQLGLPKGVSIHDLPTSEWYSPMRLTFKNGSSIEALPNTTVKDWVDSLTDAWAKLGCTSFIMSPDEIKKMEEKKMPTKFTFYVTEGTRPDKNPDGDGKGVIPTMTTEVLYKDNDGCANGGSATCDKADYNERQGCLEAIANAVLGGNFDREYEKFLADKKRKYNESCKCKICGRNYYEDEKTGKRTPFTPEDARKHEEWHEQNKQNKRERYLLRKRAKEIAFEEAAQKMAKEMMGEQK